MRAKLYPALKATGTINCGRLPGRLVLILLLAAFAFSSAHCIESTADQPSSLKGFTVQRIASNLSRPLDALKPSQDDLLRGISRPLQSRMPRLTAADALRRPRTLPFLGRLLWVSLIAFLILFLLVPVGWHAPPRGVFWMGAGKEF